MFPSHDRVELLNFGDGTIAGLTGAALTTAAKAGNKLAISAFEICADWLANAIASYTLILDPQAIIIGGGVADAGELFLTPVRASIPKYMPFVDSHPAPEIIAAKFGNNAGLIGAALLARGSRHLQNHHLLLQFAKSLSPQLHKFLKPLARYQRF